MKIRFITLKSCFKLEFLNIYGKIHGALQSKTGE